MADNILKNTIDVAVNGQTYEFKVPSYQDEIKVGIKEKGIRREIETDLGIATDGSAEGLDNATYFLVRVAAQFSVLLQKSSTKWPWTDDDKGSPIVDYKKWPNDKVNEAIAVGVAFQAELARFRDGGTSNGEPAGAETMESQPTP